MPATTKNDEGGSSRSSPSRGRCSASIAWPSRSASSAAQGRLNGTMPDAYTDALVGLIDMEDIEQ